MSDATTRESERSGDRAAMRRERYRAGLCPCHGEEAWESPVEPAGVICRRVIWTGVSHVPNAKAYGFRAGKALMWTRAGMGHCAAAELEIFESESYAHGFSPHGVWGSFMVDGRVLEREVGRATEALDHPLWGGGAKP